MATKKVAISFEQLGKALWPGMEFRATIMGATHRIGTETLVLEIVGEDALFPDDGCEWVRPQSVRPQTAFWPDKDPVR